MLQGGGIEYDYDVIIRGVEAEDERWGADKDSILGHLRTLRREQSAGTLDSTAAKRARDTLRTKFDFRVGRYRYCGK